MKRGDFIWSGVLVLLVALLCSPISHSVIIEATKSHPYAMGFMKFAILASMGELLAIRITGGNWTLPPGMIYRTAIWGTIGFCLVGIFAVFSNGTAAALQNGMLPGGEYKSALIQAIWTSALLNLAFGPVLMAGHRILDTYLDLAGGRLLKIPSIRLRSVIAHIDWSNLIEFVCVKMLVFFWIPAHTITFLLPPEYRLLYAAGLSFALGVILAIAKRRQGVSQAVAPAIAGLYSSADA